MRLIEHKVNVGFDLPVNIHCTCAAHMQGVARWTLTCRVWQGGLSRAGCGKTDSHMQGVARWTLTCMVHAACKTNNVYLPIYIPTTLVEEEVYETTNNLTNIHTYNLHNCIVSYQLAPVSGTQANQQMTILLQGASSPTPSLNSQSRSQIRNRGSGCGNETSRKNHSV